LNMSVTKEGEDWRSGAIKHAMAKHKKRFGPRRPTRKGAGKSLSALISEALGNKLNEVADEVSGKTYGEQIADKLVKDALSGKLPTPVVSKLFELQGAEARRAESEPLSDKSTEELKYYVQHGKWPESSS
jgi:hypothetical protein